MRALPEALRPWPYVLAGLGVGFLFLTEFAMSTLPLVQLGFLVLALAGLAGVLRSSRELEFWPLFVAAAMFVPLVSDSHVVGLPRCGEVHPGVACLAGTRDVLPQFVSELVTFVTSCSGIALLVARQIARRRNVRPIIDVGR